MRRLHLVCNAHLDPCWLWEWEEGAAEAASTFRRAAEFCEECKGFIFNHNEAVLYRWVETYEPELFARIQRLVKTGKWHIMGGWCLQPDCNMPSGESFVRQILLGKRYFLEKFGVEPTTAINFDPFGHSRGLVQVLRKCGYDSYLHCRPDQRDCPLPDSDYIWVGYDGSEIAGHRSLGWYGTPRFGAAREKVEAFLEQHRDREIGLVLWGVGDHGGGPSQKDLADLEALIRETASLPIVHSTPEAYFADLSKAGVERQRHEKDLNAWAAGCYTSQARLKQRHRLLENELYLTEKMVSTASIQGLMEYPYEELHAALWDLMFSEFHDILPGSSIQAVEEAGLRLLDHGLETVSRQKARAFFALASGQPRAAAGEIPILIYNPHPFPVEGIFECEFNLPDASAEKQFTVPIVRAKGRPLASQIEQEAGNVNLDWRKRCVFGAKLEPSRMNRFDCALKVLPERPKPKLRARRGRIRFKTERLEVSINCRTGLMDKYAVDGIDFLKKGAFLPLVLKDNEDPWGMTVKHFREVAGVFRLMSPKEGTRFSGLHKGELESVRIIEDGSVRTVLEALFSYKDSFLVTTYKLPKRGTEIEVHLRVSWNEKDQFLKLVAPTSLKNARYLGQVAYGRDELPGSEREVVAQKWVAAVSETHALTCINEGVYGSDFVKGEIRLSLLRSPAYSGHPIGDRPIVPQDRFTPRMDQGERQFRFWLNGGRRRERLEAVDRESLVHNEKPFALSFCPPGTGPRPLPGVVLKDSVVQLTAFKKAEDMDGYILRLFEPTGAMRTTKLSIPTLDLEKEIRLAPFELKSIRLDATHRTLTEVDLLERPV